MPHSDEKDALELQLHEWRAENELRITYPSVKDYIISIVGPTPCELPYKQRHDHIGSTLRRDIGYAPILLTEDIVDGIYTGSPERQFVEYMLVLLRLLNLGNEPPLLIRPSISSIFGSQKGKELITVLRASREDLKIDISECMKLVTQFDV
ncbi:hypothetical protein N7466_001442 [Penicillium verhagenii]|uniref:uncharacterized protein n=1 Tax=Penicillium verhagenii TaxID=1562060 RepID=UPI00254577ED|nr:uncharacterized protein N7466_001442 [Penicillium verhagenii]KAJ5938308.1 hypothetical protein N7466_001442 [Penicillium verhagenii]